MNLAAAQIQGSRERQEDSYALETLGEQELLAVIGDGLGGHPSGDRASREGVDRFKLSFLEQRLAGKDGPKEWLRGAVLVANQHIIDLQRSDPELAGMATTLVAAYVRDASLWAATVGDSYLLLLRHERLILLNELHSVGGGLTSSVGFNLTRVDLADGLALEAGDRLLLASDGLAPLGEEDAARIMNSAETAQAAAHGLLEAIESIGHPNQDNATVVAIFP